MFSALVWAFCRWWIGLRDLAVVADSLEAGVWSQLLLVGGLVVALLVYFPGSESEDDLSSSSKIMRKRS